MIELTCTACGAPRDGEQTFCSLCGTPQEPLAAAAGADRRRAPEPRVATTTEPLTPGYAPAGPAAAWPGVAPGAARTGRAGADLPPTAGTGRRFVAYLVDGFTVGALVGAVAVALFASGVLSVEVVDGVPVPGSGFVVLGLVQLAAFVALLVWEGRTGRTVGNFALGTRTVRASDVEQQHAPGFGRALVRALVVGVAGVVPVIGPVLVLVSPAFDRTGAHQGWHDRLAGTLVLDTRAAPDAPEGVSVLASRVRPEGPVTAAPGSAGPVSVGSGPGRPGDVPDGATTRWPAPPVEASEAANHAQPAPLAPPSQPAQPTQPATPAQVSQPPAGPITGVPGFSRPAPEPVVDQAPVVPAPLAPPSDGPGGTSSGASSGRWSSGDASSVDEATMLRPGAGARGTEPQHAQSFEIELENRDRVVVDGTVLVGRSPVGDDGRAVVVPIRDRTVSRTHLELGVDGGPWIMDRGSTSGTVVVSAARGTVTAPAGVRVPVRDGDVVHLGDRRIVVHVPMPGSAR
ncbi:hypothetical protein GCM10025865_05600 [Paraoerskovia sediminicola]|uniref:FHA domain-containing protein n=1 Tax=Paraoerskovia sediminicola TaxID=1138587 RepID=A0ABN6X919_9CELL|nr:RDD family protein [Paraoerskovia sediminicola]BDZ41261.1 hypothetical protein GCM10025865_05600 [Paraoerskovia sediminicola]